MSLTRLCLFLLIMIVCFLGFIAAPALCVETTEKGQQRNITESLTEEERNWLAKHPVMTLSLDEGNPPMNYRDSQGNLTGISIDYLKLIEKKLGIVIQLEGSDWNQALEKALGHQVDGIVNAASREERKAFLNFSESYFTTSVALVTRKHVETLTGLSQLAGMKVAVIRGSIRRGILEKHAPEAEIIDVSNLMEGLKLISEGKVDAFFEDLPVVHYMIETYFFSNLHVALLYYDHQAGASLIGLRNDEPELVSIINKTISEITLGEHREIRRKWLRISDNIRIQRASLLTEQEKKWLADNPVVRVASDKYWAPIEYTDSKGTFHGISIEYLKVLEEKLGVQFEITGGQSWSEQLHKVKNRELDMFSAIAQTRERNRFLEFTSPYLSVPLVIFSRQNIAYIKDLKELAGKRVGIVEGFAVLEWINEDYPSVKPIHMESAQEAMRMLQKGGLDAVIDDLVTGSYLITQLGYSDIKVSGETPYTNSISLAVRKDLPLLASAIQKAFDGMTENERNEIYRNWISIRYEHDFDYRVLLKFLLIFLFIVLLVGYWNRRLAGEIKERKLVEESLLLERNKLQKALHEVKVLSGLLPICASCKNIRDDKGYWNQIEFYISNHTDAQFSHSLCPSCAEKLYGDQDWFPNVQRTLGSDGE